VTYPRRNARLILALWLPLFALSFVAFKLFTPGWAARAEGVSSFQELKDEASSGATLGTHGIALPVIMSNYCTGPFVDSFDNPVSGWPVADTGAAVYRYVDGEYNIHQRLANRWTGVTRGDVWDESVEVRVSGRVSEQDGVWGLVFGLNDDWTDFYTFEILPFDQIWVVLHFNSSSGWSLVQHGTSGTIQPGHAFNTLSIRRGLQMDLLINSIPHLTIGERNGRVGLSAGSFDTYADFRYDHYVFAAKECPTLTAAARESLPELPVTLERPSPATLIDISR
jgi:hypothetical protein